MEWSNYALLEYDLGWICSNEGRCRSRTSTAGPYRWFCEDCRCDLCGLCHPPPGGEPAVTATAEAAAPQAPGSETEAAQPSFRVGGKVHYWSATHGRWLIVKILG